jgi:hypothetical protein
MLNKQKLIQKNKLNQLKYEELTPFQRNIMGIIEPELVLSKNQSEKSQYLTNVRKSTAGLSPKNEILLTPRGSNKF